MKGLLKKLLVQFSVGALFLSAVLPAGVTNGAVTSDGSAIKMISVNKTEFEAGSSVVVYLSDLKQQINYELPKNWKLELVYKGGDGEVTTMADSSSFGFILRGDTGYEVTPGVRGFNDGDYLVTLYDEKGGERFSTSFDIADSLPARIGLKSKSGVAGDNFEVSLFEEQSDTLVDLYQVYDVKLVDSKGATVSSVKEFTGDVTRSSKGVYTFKLPAAGTYSVKLIDMFLKELDSEQIAVTTAQIVAPEEDNEEPVAVSNDPVEFRLNNSDLIYEQREEVSFRFLNAAGSSVALPDGWYLKFIQRDGTSFVVDTRLESVRAPFHHGFNGTESTGIEMYDENDELIYAGRLHVLKPANAGGVPVRFEFNARAYAPGELVQITLYDANDKIVKRPNGWNFAFNMLTAAGGSVGSGSLEGSLNSDLSFRAMNRADVTVEVDLENAVDALVDSQNFKILDEDEVDDYLDDLEDAEDAEEEGLAREGEAVNVRLKGDIYRPGEEVGFEFIDAEGDKITTGWPAGYKLRLFYRPFGGGEFALHPLVIASTGFKFKAPADAGDYLIFVDKGDQSRINNGKEPGFAILGVAISEVDLDEVEFEEEVEVYVNNFNEVRKDLAKEVRIPGFVFNPQAAANYVGEVKCLDVPPNHWAKELMEVWVETNRYPVRIANGKIECRLDESLTRAQAALLLTAYQYPDVIKEIENIEERLTMGLIEMPFSDVPVDHPFAAWVYTANALEVMTGDNKLPRTFRPDETLNRVELLAIVQRSFGMAEVVAEIDAPGEEYNAFSDLDENAWYRKNVDFAINSGVMRGYSDGSFQPGRGVSFAEAMKIVQVGSILKNALENPAFYEEDLVEDEVVNIFEEAIAEDYLKFSEEEVDNIEVVDEMVGDMLDELGDGLGKFEDLGLEDKLGGKGKGLNGKDKVRGFMNDGLSGGSGGKVVVGKGMAASGGGVVFESFVDGGSEVGYQGGTALARDKYGNFLNVTYDENGIATEVVVTNAKGEFMGVANGQAAVDFLGNNKDTRGLVLQSTDPDNRRRNDAGYIASSPSEEQEEATSTTSSDDENSGENEQTAGENEQEPTCDENVGECGDEEEIADNCASNNVDEECEDSEEDGGGQPADCIDQDGGCDDDGGRSQAALAILCAIAGSNCEPGLADMLLAAGWGNGGECDERNGQDCSGGNRILGAIVVNGVLAGRNCDGRNGQDCAQGGNFTPTQQMIERTVCAIRDCDEDGGGDAPDDVPVGPGGRS